MRSFQTVCKATLCAAILAALTACAFESSITPMVLETAPPEPFQTQPPGVTSAPETVPPGEPLPTEPPQCVEASGRSYCVGQVLVTSGGLNLRALPEGEVLGQLDCGETVTIVGIPQSTGDHFWAEVETSTGQTGWVAVDVLDETVPTCVSAPPGVLYPGVGESVMFNRLPYDPEVVELTFWWGFGNTTFAQENMCVWYECTSGMHPGLDFGMPYNSPVYWPGDQPGVVVSVNGDRYNLGAGPYTVIIESGGFYFLFGHMSDQAPSVTTGDTIQPGQLIGYSGNPGGYDGAGNDHLHLEVRPGEGGEPAHIAINPLAFFGEPLYTGLYDMFSGDYADTDNPMSLGYYTLRPAPECGECICGLC